jgi:hypothetical protein
MPEMTRIISTYCNIKKRLKRENRKLGKGSDGRMRRGRWCGHRNNKWALKEMGTTYKFKKINAKGKSQKY